MHHNSLYAELASMIFRDLPWCSMKFCDVPFQLLEDGQSMIHCMIEPFPRVLYAKRMVSTRTPSAVSS
jgi:hypothetical protein